MSEVTRAKLIPRLKTTMTIPEKRRLVRPTPFSLLDEKQFDCMLGLLHDNNPLRYHKFLVILVRQ
jgi:hypothetical protein